jgi:excisionase family DNA binding protein
VANLAEYCNGHRRTSAANYQRCPMRKPVVDASKVSRVSLTLPEACFSLGCSMTSLYRLLNENQIPTFMVGARRLIPQAALEKFVATQSSDYAPEPEVSAKKRLAGLRGRAKQLASA